MQKSCKKVVKILQKNLQNFCRFFAEFLQLHILQKVLHFRPREESVTDSSRGLKSVCKFKICKNFAKILHRRKFLLRILQLFCNFFAIFLQFICYFIAILLQFFFTFFAKNVQKFFQKRKELEVMNLSFNSLF